MRLAHKEREHTKWEVKEKQYQKELDRLEKERQQEVEKLEEEQECLDQLRLTQEEQARTLLEGTGVQTKKKHL